MKGFEFFSTCVCFSAAHEKEACYRIIPQDDCMTIVILFFFCFLDTQSLPLSGNYVLIMWWNSDNTGLYCWAAFLPLCVCVCVTLSAAVCFPDSCSNNCSTTTAATIQPSLSSAKSAQNPIQTCLICLHCRHYPFSLYSQTSWKDFPSWKAVLTVL